MAAPASFLHGPSRHVIASRRSTSRPEYVNDSGHRTVKGDTMHRLDPVGAAA
jgi:hypothetical protein